MFFEPCIVICICKNQQDAHGHSVGSSYISWCTVQKT